MELTAGWPVLSEVAFITNSTNSASTSSVFECQSAPARRYNCWFMCSSTYRVICTTVANASNKPYTAAHIVEPIFLSRSRANRLIRRRHYVLHCFPHKYQWRRVRVSKLGLVYPDKGDGFWRGKTRFSGSGKAGLETPETRYGSYKPITCSGTDPRSSTHETVWDINLFSRCTQALKTTTSLYYSVSV